MAGGKISPEIKAAADQAVAAMRDEMAILTGAVIQVIADRILPLQQDVTDLKTRVRNLEQGGDGPPK
jgi:hypothetical protein